MLDDSYKALLKVSVPVMMGMLIQFAIFITDAAFLGRLPSSIPFDAVSTAGLIILTLTSACYGLYHGSQILIAKYLGKDNEQISLIFYNSFFVLLIIAAITYGLTLFISNNFLDNIVESKVLVLSMNEFLNVRSIGFFFSLPGFAFLAFYTGIAQTRFLVWSSIVIASSNIFLDYAMIFGEFGFAERGMLGAAWASNIAEVIGLVFGIFYLAKNKKSREIIQSSKISIQWDKIKEILNTSSPLMIQGLLATLGWSVFFLLIEKIGLKELEVSQVIRNIYYIALVPIIGFSSTTKTYVSHFISHKVKRERLIKLLVKLSVLSTSAILIIAIFNLIIPEMIIKIITNKEHVIKESVPVLKLISGAMIIFAFSSILVNAIAGAGRTMATMLIEAVTIAIYLVMSYYVTIVNYTSFYLVWSMEYLYFILLGIFSFIYIFKTNLFQRHEQ